ncbi:MAG: SCO family protein [Hyphomicrobiales bacterium]
MGKSSRLIGMGAAVLAAVLALFLYLQRGAPENTAVQIGGPFVLPATTGETIDSAKLAGHPYGMFFGFTHCPEVCPTTLYDMTTTLEALGPAGKDFRMFFVTVDPARDTVEDLKTYVSNFDPRIAGLVPTDEQLQKMAHDFRVFYKKVPTSDGGYTMDHTATVFLFNAQGEFAGTLSFGEEAPSRLAKMKRLLGAS